SIWMKRSAATMPLWAARIRRTVTAARPQRVCEISEVDARACGCKPQSLGGLEYGLAAAFNLKHRAYGSSFANLWQSDHGSRYPWESAWCWVLQVQG
ncbi:MAG: hypothetical protein ABFD60_10595, partial [Bryobacteraceae bacterium]